MIINLISELESLEKQSALDEVVSNDAWDKGFFYGVMISIMIVRKHITNQSEIRKESLDL